jgi:cytochrome c6
MFIQRQFAATKRFEQRRRAFPFCTPIVRSRLLPFSLVLIAALFGCSNSQPATQYAKPSSHSVAPVTPLEDGHGIFMANCTPCHGRNADGDTPAGRTWHVPNLHSPQVQSADDQVLLQIIRQGKGKMPAWGGLLSQTDMEHVLVYIRSLRQS